jgi:hypothetical protein
MMNTASGDGMATMLSRSLAAEFDNSFLRHIARTKAIRSSGRLSLMDLKMADLPEFIPNIIGKTVVGRPDLGFSQTVIEF